VPRNNKAKGGKFERDICTQLSLWWSNGKSDDLFWRTAGSGGRATSRAKKGKTTKGHAGDVCATDESSQPLIDCVAIELKRGYAKHTLYDVFDKPPNAAIQEWEKWVNQAMESQKQCDTKSWLLIHKRDRRNTLIFFPPTLISSLERCSDACIDFPYPQVRLSYKPEPKRIVIVRGCLFDNFLKVVKPKYFINLLNRG